MRLIIYEDARRAIRAQLVGNYHNLTVMVEHAGRVMAAQLEKDSIQWGRFIGRFSGSALSKPRPHLSLRLKGKRRLYLPLDNNGLDIVRAALEMMERFRRNDEATSGQRWRGLAPDKRWSGGA